MSGMPPLASSPLWLYPVLFLTGLLAGFVDSIAGGGGVITIPVLLNLGMHPLLALGTNKFQASFGSASAVWHYSRAGLIDFRGSRMGVLCTAAGALGGALSVRSLRPELLRQIIPWLLIAIAAYSLSQPRLGESRAKARMGPGTFHVLFGLGIGFYDGFFGPGTGTFWAMAYVMMLGLDLQRATAHTKLMNFTSNLASLGVFLAWRQVELGAGLAMGLGQIVGARLGSRVVIFRGARWIRPAFVTMALLVTARLLWQNLGLGWK